MLLLLPPGDHNLYYPPMTMVTGYDGEHLSKILHKVSNSSVVLMDRWEIEFSAPENSQEQGDPIPYNIINNYFSIGVVSVGNYFGLNFSVFAPVYPSIFSFDWVD